MKRQNNLGIMLFLVFGVIVASVPLFRNTIFGVVPHDTFFHTQRIVSIQKALEAGQFPVRIYTEIYNGYGYGAPLFYPDIFLYIPAVLCILGVPLATSYNFFLILINIATILIGYYSFFNITKSNVIGLLATMLYTLSTYRLVDLYTRSSIGECLALVFCPLAIWGFTAISRGEYKKWPVLVIAYSGLLQSHMLSLVMMVLVGMVLIVLRFKAFWNKKAIISLLKAVFFTILLNAWFLVPLLQASNMNVIAFIGKTNYWQTGADFWQLWDVRCLTAGGRELYDYGVSPSMPKTPGVLLLIGALCMVASSVLCKRDFNEEKKRAISYAIAGLMTTSMVTYLFPWKLVEKIRIFKLFFEKFQFIWRWNILAILFLSVAAAYGFNYVFRVGKKHTPAKVLLLVIWISLMAIPYLRQYMKQAVEYTNEEALVKGYMDNLYVVPGFDTADDGNFVSNIENIQITNVVKGYLEVTANFHCVTKNTKEEAPYIEAPVAYYPGYKAYINGEEIKAECSVWGVPRVYIPEDVMEGTLHVAYEGNIVCQIANIVSLLMILIALVYSIWKGIYKKWIKNKQLLN